MKIKMTIKKVVLATIVLLGLYSCNSNSSAEITIISQEDGEVLYLKNFKNVLDNKFDTLKLKKDVAQTIKLDTKMDMGVLIDPKSRKQVNLYINNAKPSSVTIKSFKTFDYSFSGENAAINDYFKKRLNEEQIFRKLMDKSANIEQVTNELLAGRKKDIESVKDTEFKKIEEGNIKYLPKTLLIAFYRQILPPEKYDSIKELATVLKEKVIEEPQYVKSEIYLAYVKLRFSMDAQKKNIQKSIDLLEAVKKQYKEEGIKNKIYENLTIQSLFSPIPLGDEAKKIQKFFEDNYTGNKKREILAKIKEKIKKEAEMDKMIPKTSQGAQQSQQSQQAPVVEPGKKK